MSVSCQLIINNLEQWAPTTYAESWDNVGLQIGRKDKIISKIMVALTASQAVIDEAIGQQADLLITHHPLIFKPIDRIVADHVLGQQIMTLIHHDLNVYCAHTNLDIATGGVNDVLAQRLALEDVQILHTTREDGYVKLVIYIPEGYEATVREAICQAGAGCIGNYEQCTFHSQGIGTFLANSGTEPFLGEVGHLTHTKESRLETIVPLAVLPQVLTAMAQAHPYEEVAYDVFKLEIPGKAIGLGRMGYLQKPVTLAQFMQRVIKVLDQSQLSYTGSLDDLIQKVALCGGSGASYLKQAKRLGADVYLTGDIKYHDAQLADELGIAVVDAGHFATEKLVVQAMANHLQDYFVDQGVDIVVYDQEKDFMQYFNGK